jgi:C-terminal processing protease CtpA/Prc
VAFAPSQAQAQARSITELLQSPSPLLRASSQGYLGVDLADVDNEKAQALRLKEVRGALITLIDHDAPAGQVGLRVNDVVLSLNGQNIESAEQLRRMLREIPVGRKLTMVISRDGNQQTVGVQLADRRAIEQEAWHRIGNRSDNFAQAPVMGIVSNGSNSSLPRGFDMPAFGGSLNVGALVEPLTSQMAEYLGVQSGLMVKQVARKSEAAASGLKAFDVILRVGPESINTVSDWARALQSNQGRSVQVTILRDKKQQTVTLQVDSKRRGEMKIEDLFPNGDCPLFAELDPDFARNLADEAEAIRNQIGTIHMEMDPLQAEEMHKMAEQLRDSFKSEDFKLDQKQMDQLKQQMDEMRKSFKSEDFKLDSKQMDELRQQMDQLKQQMKEMQTLEFGK